MDGPVSHLGSLSIQYFSLPLRRPPLPNQHGPRAGWPPCPPRGLPGPCRAGEEYRLLQGDSSPSSSESGRRPSVSSCPSSTSETSSLKTGFFFFFESQHLLTTPSSTQLAFLSRCFHAPPSRGEQGVMRQILRQLHHPTLSA